MYTLTRINYNLMLYGKTILEKREFTTCRLWGVINTGIKFSKYYLVNIEIGSHVLGKLHFLIANDIHDKGEESY